MTVNVNKELILHAFDVNIEFIHVAFLIKLKVMPFLKIMLAFLFKVIVNIY